MKLIESIPQQEKVGRYWPETFQKTEEYGEVKVATMSEKKYLDYTARSFLVSLGAHSRHVSDGENRSPIHPAGACH